MEEAKIVYLPREVNEIGNNTYYIDNSDTGANHMVESNFGFDIDQLVVNNDYRVNKDYLLPTTFAKNVAIAVDIAKRFEVEDKTIITALENVSLPPSRFTLLAGINNSTIFDSSYNSDPDSLLGLITTLKMTINRQAGTQNQRPYYIYHNLVLGEMRELGDAQGFAKVKHNMILDKLIELSGEYEGLIDNICLLGSQWLNSDQTPADKSEDNHNLILYKGVIFKVFLKAGDINRYLEDKIRPHSWIWIKGSQNTIFSEIVTEHFLADKFDLAKVARQDQSWRQMRKDYE